MKIKILRLLNALLLLNFIITPRASAQAPVPQDPRAAGLGEPIEIFEEDIIIHRSPDVQVPYQIWFQHPSTTEDLDQSYQTQDTFLALAEAELGRSLEIIPADINQQGTITLKLFKSEAKQLLSLPEVLRIARVYDPEETDPEYSGTAVETANETIREAPLPVTKTVSQDLANPGDTLTYTITIPSNRTGDDLAYDIYDTLPEGVTYVPDSLRTWGSDIPATYDIENNKVSWGGVMQNFELRYEMSNNLTNPDYCKMPISANGLYYDLLTEESKRTTNSISGDGTSFTLGYSLGAGTEFFGEINPYPIIFTDDGLVILYEDFESYDHYGLNVPENQNLPDPAEPNGILSPLWWDMDIVYDDEFNKGVTGIYWTGENPAWLVEFDDIEDWYYETLSMDFEVFAWLEPDHDIGFPDIVFAYDNVTGNWFDPDSDGTNTPDGTIGIENREGTQGYTYAYNNYVPKSGDIICFDYYEVGRDPVVITFAVTVNDVLVSPENLPGRVITNTASYTIDDITTATTQASFTINDIPIADPQTLVTDEDVPLPILLSGSDVIPGDTVIYKITQPLYGKALAGEGGLPNVVYTPDEHWFGTDSFTFTVGDGLATSLPATITITVNSVNDLPVITIPDQTIAEGETFTAIPLDDFVTDVESDNETLTWSHTGSTELDINIDENRILTIAIPHIDWFGAETITLSATDPDGGIGTQDVLFTVTPVNDPHIVSDIPDQTIDEYGSFTPIPLDDYVTDIDNYDEDMIWVYSGASALIVTIDLARVATVTASYPEWNGAEEINFTTIDPEGLAISDTAIFTINPLNSPPTAGNDSFETPEDTSLILSTLDLLQNDSDPESDAGDLSISNLYNPVNGSVSIEGETITFNPTSNFSGTAGFDYTLTDDELSDDGHVTIIVRAVNDPPTMNDIPNQVIDEGDNFAEIALDDYVTDVDHNISDMLWSFSGSIHLGVEINQDRVATITTPNQDWFGSETITFTATDPDGASDSSSATFTVTAVNDPPILADIPSQTIAEGSAFATINLNDFVTDVDNVESEITWTISGASNLIVGIDENRFATISPFDENWNGSETITFTASDPGGMSNSDTATFRVTAVNDPPVVDEIPGQTISEGATFAAINLNNFVADVDNTDTEIYWSFTGNTDLILSISPDRTVTISTPNGNWNGEQIITFTARDPGGLSDETQTILAVTPVNDAPINSLPTNLSIVEDTPTPITTISVSDVDVTETLGGQLEINISVSRGAISLSQISGLAFTVGDGQADSQMTFSGTMEDINLALQSMIYQPEENFVGEVSLSFISNDQGFTGSGGPLMDEDLILITVKENNMPPIAAADAYTLDEDTSKSIGSPGVLGNDNDQDSDPLVAILTSNVSSGTLSLNPNGSFSFQPNENFSGEDHFSYQASDGSAASGSVSVTLTIDPVNDPPSAAQDEFVTPEDTELQTSVDDLLVNDSDIDNEHADLIITGVAAPFNGTVALNGETIIFTPTTDFFGMAGFDYTLSDAELSSTGYVIIDVLPVNDPPVVNTIPEQVIDEGESFIKIYLDDHVSDVDDDITEILWTFSGNDELGVVISSDRVVTISIPDLDWHGTETITFRAADPGEEEAQMDVSFTALPVNDSPIVGDIPGQTVLEGGAFIPIDLKNFVSDVDDPDADITWSISGAFHLDVSINENHIATISPLDENWNGTETITFTASDPGKLSDYDTATFRVTPVNDPPVVSDIPAQTILEGNTFSPIKLDDYITDVDNQNADITWTFSEDTQLNIEIGSDRVATISTPDKDWNGTETITFTATDPGGLPDQRTVNFTVTPVNDPPVALNQTVTTENDTSIDILLEGIDVDGDPLTYIILVQPSNGSLSGEEPNLTYTPDPGWFGEDHFRFIVKDSEFYSNEARVTVIVERSGWSIFLPLILR